MVKNLIEKDIEFLRTFFRKYKVPAGKGLQALVSDAISEYKSFKKIRK